MKWTGLATWVAGTAVYLVISGLPPLGVPGVAPWLGASLPSFCVAFVLQLALGRLPERPAAPALARS